MPEFSKRSRDELSSCDIHLQRLFNEVIKELDCSILEGHRGRERQNELFRTGFSKVKYPHSSHNHVRSHGVDVVPYPIDWSDYKRFYYFAGYVSKVAKDMDIKIRWGGNWDGDFDFKDNKFNDLAHWELKD